MNSFSSAATTVAPRLQALKEFALSELRANAADRAHAEMAEERLPFTIRLVSDENALSKAVQVRHAAYARHVPDFAEALRMPEANDFENGVAVLLAESKLDGSPLGTMRIQTNRHKPLTLEKSLALPQWLHDSSLAEATRLAVANDATSRVVKTALFKAFFLYCQQQSIEWMVITARAPIDRQYERLMFEDVYPGLGYVPMAHVNNLPHRVLSFEVGMARARWEDANHPMQNFFCETVHPDILISGSPVAEKRHSGVSLGKNPLSNKASDSMATRREITTAAMIAT
ncbi:MAG: hypothetical protein RJA34_1563 [Pseudomonadota bacterium]|jgi:hypothetical protein